MPGHHTGQHLAEAFIDVLDQIDIVTKVCIVYMHPDFALIDKSVDQLGHPQ